MTRSSQIKPTPLWQEHDFRANKAGPRHLIVLDDGTEYVGEWEGNLRHGTGSHFTAKGMYEGEFYEDEYYGHGSYYIWSDEYEDGKLLLYEGEWVNGKMQGSGKQLTKEGHQYEGEFFEGKRHGNGKMVYINGDIYEGEWEAGLRHGSGRFTKANQDWFEGIYFNDLRNGYGVLHLVQTQRRLEGYWKDDAFKGGSYYDEPENPVYVLPTDVSGTTDGMIPTLELLNADEVLRTSLLKQGLINEHDESYQEEEANANFEEEEEPPE